MRKNRCILAFLILMIVFFSCNVQAPIISNPTDFKVEGFDFKEINLKIWLPIENPNDFQFNVKNVDLDIYVNDMKLGKVKKLEKVHIPGNSKDIYSIKLDVQIKELGISAISAMTALKGRNVEVKLDGSVTVSKFVIVKKVKVEVEESVKIW